MVVALSLWPLARFCHHQTKGFSLAKIQGNTTCLPDQTSSPLPDSISHLLDQKFTYLDRGLQSFSFLSEDGKFVLKLFNNRYQRRVFWLKLLPGSKNKIAYNLTKWSMAFESYQLAYEQLQTESGLLFFHPQKSSDYHQVTLVDTLGSPHTIDLSKFAYALQKKATLAYPYLTDCVQEGRWEEAEKALTSLVALIKRKMDLGIADRDPLIRTNLGFLDGKAMQIDIGPLSCEKTPKNKDQQKEEITKVTLSLKHWIENHQPELLPLFYEAIH